MKIMILVIISMTQSSEKICEDLDSDKKDLNGWVISEKSQFSSDPSKEYDCNETSHDFQVSLMRILIAEQKKAPEICSLFDKALPEDEIFSSTGHSPKL